MKRINVNPSAVFALPFLLFIYMMLFLALTMSLKSTSNGYESDAVGFEILMSSMFLLCFASSVAEKMNSTAILAIIGSTLSPVMLYTAGIMNLLDTIVISEILKVLLVVLVSLESIKKTNEINRSSKIFWRLIISVAVFDFTMLTVFYGANTIATLIVSVLAFIALWLFLPENKNEFKTELEKINGQENMLSEQRKFLPIAAVIFGFSVLILLIRDIYLAINAPFEQQGESVIKIIAMLMSCLAILATGYLINKKLNQQLNSLWSQKKLLFLA